jgi:hypothetical protein
MSGGHFMYKQYEIGYIADEVEHLILTNTSKETDSWGDIKGAFYSEETIAEFEHALKLLREAQIYLQRIDWLVSCDDSEDSFHNRLKVELAKLKKEKNNG